MRRYLEGLFAAAAVLLAFFWAKYKLFTVFQPYDDEGYVLLSLVHYLHGGGLYTKTYSQYGPFYFYAQQSLHALLHLPVTHDGGRIITLIYWYVSALVGGYFVYRLSRSVLLGSSAVMACTILGQVLSNEPSHPQQIVLVLLMLSCCLGLWKNWMALFLMGAVGTALVFTKINVGVFYLVALTHTLLCLLPKSWGRSAGLAITIAYAAAFPLVLMHSYVFTSAGGYCIWATLCGTAVFVAVLLCQPDRSLSIGAAIAAFTGAAAAAGAILIATQVQGISLRSLVDGMIIGPSGQATGFKLPWHFELWQVLAGASITVLSIGVLVWRSRLAAYANWIDAFRCFAGFAIVLALAGVPRSGLIFAAPLLPLLLFQRDGSFSFPRLFLVALAASQVLQPYPVAGSQVSVAAAPAMLCGFVLISDGLSQTRKDLVAVILILVMGIGIMSSSFRFFGYRDPSLDLPGARLIHLAPREADRYRWLADSLRPNCDVLFTMPGMGSLNLWSGVPTPNGYHLTHWMTVFNARRQQEILDILRANSRACVVYNKDLVDLWVPDGLELSPLSSYILRDMRTVAARDGYEILVSPDRSSPFEASVR